MIVYNENLRQSLDKLIKFREFFGYKSIIKAMQLLLLSSNKSKNYNLKNVPFTTGRKILDNLK